MKLQLFLCLYYTVRSEGSGMLCCLSEVTQVVTGRTRIASRHSSCELSEATLGLGGVQEASLPFL